MIAAASQITPFLSHVREFRVGVADAFQDFVAVLAGVRRVAPDALEKPEMLIAEATTSFSPTYGLVIFVAMPRCLTCGSANTWSIE